MLLSIVYSLAATCKYCFFIAGINRIAVVPKGALKVIIREKESTTNYIGK